MFYRVIPDQSGLIIAQYFSDFRSNFSTSASPYDQCS